MVKKVGILGSTGSIGKQTIEVVKELNACEFECLCEKEKNHISEEMMGAIKELQFWKFL